MKVVYQSKPEQTSTPKMRILGFTLIASAIILNTVWVTALLAGVIEAVLWMTR